MTDEQAYASQSKWRHQESSAYNRHAGANAPRGHNVREAGAAPDSHINGENTTNDLANFLNKDRMDGARPPHTQPYNPNAQDQPNVHPIVVDPSKPQPTIPVGGQHDGTFLSRAEADLEGQRTEPELGPHTGGLDGGKISPRKASREGDIPEVDDMESAFKYKPDWEGEAKRAGQPTDGREVRCGPLLNYRRMEDNQWYGSVLMVVKGGRLNDEDQQYVPALHLRKVGSRDPTPQLSRADTGQVAEEQLIGKEDYRDGKVHQVKGQLLYADMRARFWRFTMQLEMEEAETQWEYEIPGLRWMTRGKRDKQHFWVPSVHESMRIMFHSCNGFSVGTDEEEWSGAALWNDVARVHAETPFHVM